MPVQDYFGYDADIRIPTVQYGYVEVHVTGTPDDIKNAHDELNRLFTVGEGLSTKDFQEAMDEYLSTGTVKGGIGIWEKMNKYQQDFFQEVKKSMKRRNYKETKEK